MIKKIVKSQQKRMEEQVEGLRKGARDQITEKVMLARQQEYLRDMHRCASEGKTKFYRSGPNFYTPL